MEAGELLGCSQRQFRRYRRSSEEEAPDGLLDCRLDKASARPVPMDAVQGASCRASPVWRRGSAPDNGPWKMASVASAYWCTRTRALP